MKHYIFFIGLFAVLLLFSLNRHSKAGVFSYHSEIWADKAGYNVYLPALFIYGFEAKNFPDSLDVKTGDGFLLDKNKNKVITKYSYGVALLESPFWLVAHLLAKEKSGFSNAYHKAINVSSVFYFTLGLYFIYLLLLKKIDKKKSLWAIFLLVFGTNLFYYSTYETGMSHIYSFAILSGLLYFLEQENISIGVIILSLLTLLVRPINIVFLIPILIFFNLNSFENVKHRLKNIFTIKNIGIGSCLAFLLFLPQFWYYHFVNGSIFSSSYGKESFVFFTNPKIVEVLFAPNNGFFLHSPILLLMFFSFRKLSKFDLILPTVLFLIYIGLYSSWWSYMLGCGFGHRAFIDILPIYILCFGMALGQTKSSIFLFLCVLCTFFTLKLMLSFDTCFYGKYDWDWNVFFEVLKGKLK